jgi:hypothetical protein
MENGQGLVSWIGHAFSSVTLVGAIVGWFPGVAAAVALLWYSIQIYESNTFQRWLTTRRLQKIAQLKIEMARLEALELVAHPHNRADIAPARVAAAELIESAKVAAQEVVDTARDKK